MIWRIKKGHLFIAGILIVFIAVTLSFLYPPTLIAEKIIYTAIGELGFTLIIAAFIISLVDEREREDLINAERRLAANNFLAYSTNLEIPVSISESFSALLANSPFVKRKHHTKMVIRALDSEFAEIVQEIDYTVFNAGKKTKEFVVPFYVDDEISLSPKMRKMAGLINARLTKRRSNSTNFDVIFEQDTSDILPMSHNNYKISTKLGSGEEVHVTVTLKNIKRTNDTELWVNLILAENYSVSVEFKEDQFEIECRPINASMHDDKQVIPRPVLGGLSFEFPFPLLVQAV